MLAEHISTRQLEVISKTKRRYVKGRNDNLCLQVIQIFVRCLLSVQNRDPKSIKEKNEKDEIITKIFPHYSKWKTIKSF